MSAIEHYRKDIITTRNLIRELEGITPAHIEKVQAAEAVRDTHLGKIVLEEERLHLLMEQAKAMIEDGSWLELDLSAKSDEPVDEAISMIPNEPEPSESVHEAVAAIADDPPETVDASSEGEEWVPETRQSEKSEDKPEPASIGAFSPWG